MADRDFQRQCGFQVKEETPASRRNNVSLLKTALIGEKNFTDMIWGKLHVVRGR